MINGGQLDDPLMNERARLYARMYELPMTSGSDAHHADQLTGCGVVVEDRIEKATDYLDMLKAGKLTLLQGN